MKLEFPNSIVRLSFLCHITDMKIAWINLCPSHCPTQSNFIELITELCWAANLLKKAITSNVFLQMKHFRKSIFVIW